MIETSCHCGAVTIRIDGDPPEYLTSCNCSVCRRLAGLWMYFAPAQVKVAGSTVAYRWGDKSLDLHHCGTCGCTTHWTPVTAPNDRMGINARLADPALVAGTRIRRIDGADTWKFLD